MALFTRNKKVDEARPTPPAPPTFISSPFWPTYGTNAEPRVITSDNVLGLPAAWRAVNLIANAVATMSPLELFNGEEEAEAPLLLTKPAPDMDTFDFFHLVATSMILEGQFIGLPLERDEQGVPSQILPVPNAACVVSYDDNGKLAYQIDDMILRADNILHIRNYTRPGDPNGIGAVAAFRQAIGHQLDRQGSATAAMTGIPSGIVKIHTKEVTAEQAAATKSDWLTAFAAGTRAPAVLSDSMDFTPISFSAQDSQWIQSAQLGVADIAFMFGLDPADLGATVGGSNLTYSNIVDRQVDRVTSSYGPYIRRIEEAFSSLLPGDQHAKLQVERLFRTTPDARADYLGKMIASGVYTVEYAQQLEGVPTEYRAATPDTIESND